MGKTLSFAEVDQLSRDFAAWLQAKGLPKGARVAIMMPNVLQYPVALFGTLRAGYTVVNVNPLYTPRELEHQLKDSGAEVIVILENFAVTLQEVLARTPIKHVVVTALGDMLGLKGLLVNFVVRNVKKMVPAYSLPTALSWSGVLSEARQADEAFRGRPRGHRLPAVHGRHHWRVQGRDAAPPQHPRQHRAGLGQPLLGAGRRAAGDHHRAAALPYLLAHGELPADGEDGRREHPHHQPARHPGFVKELGKHRYNMITGVNTLFNAFLNNAEFLKLDFTP
jgi:long-chain acyl-CoA synthetase